MLLILVRAVFVLVTAGFAVKTARIVGEYQLANPYMVFIGIMLAAIVGRGRRPSHADGSESRRSPPFTSA